MDVHLNEQYLMGVLAGSVISWIGCQLWMTLYTSMEEEKQCNCNETDKKIVKRLLRTIKVQNESINKLMNIVKNIERIEELDDIEDVQSVADGQYPSEKENDNQTMITDHFETMPKEESKDEINELFTECIEASA